MRGRAAVAILLALASVAAVLGVQFANGGGDFVPARVASPCVARKVSSVSQGIDGLTERLVLLGLDGAACRLGVTRERLTLDLATPGRKSAAQVAAVRAGLLQAVARMKADGTLPPASDLVDDAVDDSGLNPFVKFAIKHLPDSVVNASLKTDDVLRRTVNNLDLAKLLANLNDPDELDRELKPAVETAVKDSLIDRLKSLV